MRLLLCLLELALLWCCAHSVEEKNGASQMSTFKSQRAAVRAWANSLTDEDFDVDHWTDVYHTDQPQNYFEGYAKRLSALFSEKNAFVHFALVGACDGTHDSTIRDLYLPHDHWRGVFVEPFEMNYNDLKSFMETHNVIDRTVILHAAATRKCNETTIKMKRPMFEEKNKSLPHWMRRQIGSVVPFDKLDRPATGSWTFEFTRCVNGPLILKDWATALSDRQMMSKSLVRVRPHVLKVDVEGHDYQVLMGFLDLETPSAELPLLISFEAKSILGNLENLRNHLTARGYVVSRGETNDGFAILRPDVFLKKRKDASTDNESSGDPESANDADRVKYNRPNKKARKASHD